MLNWKEYGLVSGDQLEKAEDIYGVPPVGNLAVMAHVDRAAITALQKFGEVQGGDNVLVSAAAGGTGALAAQIAKFAGGRVIGMAGGPEKGKYLTGELGLDGAIGYKAGNLG